MPRGPWGVIVVFRSLRAMELGRSGLSLASSGLIDAPGEALHSERSSVVACTFTVSCACGMGTTLISRTSSATDRCRRPARPACSRSDGWNMVTRPRVTRAEARPSAPVFIRARRLPCRMRTTSTSGMAPPPASVMLTVKGASWGS